MPTLHIGSFNCQYKKGLATAFINSRPPRSNMNLDIACTQESGTREQLQELIKYQPNFYVASAPFNDPAVCAITTKRRASNRGQILLEAGLQYLREALYVVYESDFLVINVHFTSGNPGRGTQELGMVYNFILNHYANYPWLIIGDFNFIPTQGLFNTPVTIVQGPRHSKGGFLDWAVGGNIRAITRPKPYLPDYGASDHTPWYVRVDY